MASERQPDGVHTIPVPHGWSPEQAWEAIKNGDALPDPEPMWANVLIEDGCYRYLYDEWEKDDAPQA